MSYCTVSQFRTYAFPSGSFSNVSDEVIQHELNQAASEINAKLRVKHTLPLITSSYGIDSDLAVIYGAEIIMASYTLLMYRGMKPNINGTNDEILFRRYSDIKEPENGLLAQIADGRILFPDSSDSTPTVSEGRSKCYGTESRYATDSEDYI